MSDEQDLRGELPGLVADLWTYPDRPHDHIAVVPQFLEDWTDRGDDNWDPNEMLLLNQRWERAFDSDLRSSVRKAKGL